VSDDFSEEHQLIAGVVTAFAAYVDALEVGGELERADLPRFVTFFRDFCDLAHHEKEEGLLIPAMVRNGCSFDDGPVERVHKEHEHERSLMSSLRQAALQRDPWSADARRRVVIMGRAYVDFMREHIRLEEQELFPRADKCLPPDVAAELTLALRKFDAELDQQGERTWLLGLAQELAAHYAPALGKL
jgi:hemerythrin-like domain-containing protein